LLALRNEEEDRVFQLSGGEIDCLHQSVTGGNHVNVGILTTQREQLELPGLPAVEHAQAIGFDLDGLEIDDAGEADVLLDPGILDGLGIDAENSFGQIAEGAVRFFLHFENLGHLLRRENPLLDE
jgi:hypothetical protein